MTYDKMDSSAVYAMFEEIKEDLNKRPAQQAAPAQPTATAPKISAEDIDKIERLTESLDSVNEKLDIPLKHRHTIDFMSSKALSVLAAAIVALMISVVIVNNQRGTIKQFRDNDLRYRYIQMKGQAAPEDVLMLRDVFDYNRNADSIKAIRQRVERYEQLIQEQAESEARARLNAEEADQLQRKLENLKN